MLGDLRVLDTGESCCSSASASRCSRSSTRIRRFNIGFDCELHKRTVERGLLSLVGRDAALAGRGPPRSTPAREASRRPRVAARPHRRRDRRRLRQRRHRARRGRARGRRRRRGDEAAAEVLRVEAGRPRYGVDLDDSVIPQEAGLNERAVSFTKGCYVGQETVARLHLQAASPTATCAGCGWANGCSPAPRCGWASARSAGSAPSPPRRASAPIALALVRREAQPGDVLDAGGVSAEVVDCRSPEERRASAVAPSARGASAQLGRASCDASHVPTVRTSSTSSGASQPRAPAAVARAQRRARAPLHVVERRRQRAPVGDAPADEPERVEARRRAGARRARGAGARASRRARRRGGRAAPRAARAGAAARPRARSAARAAAARICASRWASSAAPPSPPPVNSAERRVEPAAVEVGVEVAQARRQAAAHLPVGRRVVAARQLAAAVAQAEQRVELLDAARPRRGARAAARR